MQTAVILAVNSRYFIVGIVDMTWILYSSRRQLRISVRVISLCSDLPDGCKGMSIHSCAADNIHIQLWWVICCVGHITSGSMAANSPFLQRSSDSVASCRAWMSDNIYRLLFSASLWYFIKLAKAWNPFSCRSPILASKLVFICFHGFFTLS